MEKIDDLLEERQHDYGEFSKGIAFQTELLRLIKAQYRHHHGMDLPNEFNIYFMYMMIKLSRLSVSPEHLDSWKDIEGYAHLIHDNILEKYDAKEK